MAHGDAVLIYDDIMRPDALHSLVEVLKMENVPAIVIA